MSEAFNTGTIGHCKILDRSTGSQSVRPKWKVADLSDRPDFRANAAQAIASERFLAASA
ncbi:MAG TPA: hypothetical protein V6D46_03380 [Coleofasciculaceae cyanobacterium]